MSGDANVVEHIHQVLFVKGGALPERLPARIAANANEIKKLYPDATYRLWNMDAARSLIEGNFSPDVAWAFETLQPYSYKCDLARFCVLYIYGGIYVDMGVQVVARWDVPSRFGIAAFRDVPFVTMNWATLQTGLVWARPARAELKLAIDYIVENCRSRFYGRNPLYPTGPVVLGRAFIAAMTEDVDGRPPEDQYVGECRCLTPEAEMLNVAYVTSDGRVVAYRKKVLAGDLSHLGLAGTDNYNEIWRHRQVYAEPIRTWRGDDPLLRLGESAQVVHGEIIIGGAAQGHIVYGPYVDLEAGSYTLRVQLKKNTRFSNILIDVSFLQGKSIICASEIGPSRIAADNAIELDFALPEARREVEFRITAFGDFEGGISALELRMHPYWLWNATDPQLEVSGVQRSDAGIVIPPEVSGRVVFGPYVPMKAGNYELNAIFEPGAKFSRCKIDVCCNRGGAILAEVEFGNGVLQSEEVLKLAFVLKEDISDTEFRIEVFGGFTGTFKTFRLLRVSDIARTEENRQGRPAFVRWQEKLGRIVGSSLK